MDDQGNILIIDDKKSDAEEFERVLRAEGYEVETAATAEAGLARAKQESFDVVLTDLHLSGSDEQPKKGLDIVCELPPHAAMAATASIEINVIRNCIVCSSAPKRTAK